MIASPENMTGVSDEDRDWLANQPNMQPWEQGCEDLVKQMAAWIEQHTGNFCEAAIGADSKNYANYESRVWQCWRHHWKEAVEASLNQPVDGYKLAGAKEDLLCDVILVEAMLQGSNKAIALFEADTEADRINWARKVSPAFVSEMSWWQDLLTKMIVGTQDSKGTLSTFIGTGSLHAWLRTTAKRELWRIAKREKRERDAWQSANDAESADDCDDAHVADAMSSECTKLLVAMLKDLLSEVAEKERAAVLLCLAQGLTNTQVAQVLDIHPGNVGRTFDRFIGRMRERLERADALGSPRAQALSDCIDHVFDSQNRTHVLALLQRLASKDRDGEN